MNVKDSTLVIGYVFKDPDLLQRALTHRSYGAANNERLEYLGDSVLNLAIAIELYHKFPLLNEGDLSRLRSSLVSRESLAATGNRRGLAGHMFLGEGERRSGGLRRPSIVADAVEAVIGAVFLDGGFECARSVVQNLFDAELDKIDPRTTGKDPKTLLQEYLQSRRMALPEYNIVHTSGEAHKQWFRVECLVPEFGIRCLGEGSSRRSAEQQAARQAYDLACTQ